MMPIIPETTGLENEVNEEWSYIPNAPVLKKIMPNIVVDDIVYLQFEVDTRAWSQNIYYRKKGEIAWIFVDNTKYIAYSHKGNLKNGVYEYSVTSINNMGESYRSNIEEVSIAFGYIPTPIEPMEPDDWDPITNLTWQITPEEITRIKELEEETESPDLLYLYSDFHGKATRKLGLRWYHTNKIRYYLEKIHMNHGYPCKFKYKVDFYSLVYVIILTKNVIMRSETDYLWENVKSHQWRTLIIGEIMEGVTWLDIMGGIANAFTLGFGNYLAALGTQKRIPVYENLTFFGTVHDVIIYANWDKILLELNREGY